MCVMLDWTKPVCIDHCIWTDFGYVNRSQADVLMRSGEYTNRRTPDFTNFNSTSPPIQPNPTTTTNQNKTKPTKMNLLTYLSLALTLVTSTTAASLDIKTTHSTDCSRRTQRGDTIHMHYRGTLASTKQEFDSSYKRDEPLVIPIGEGIVIRGWVPFHLPVFDRVGELGDIYTYVVLNLETVLTILTVDGMKDCWTCALGINAR